MACKQLPTKCAKPGALILQRYGLLVPSATRYTPAPPPVRHKPTDNSKAAGSRTKLALWGFNGRVGGAGRHLVPLRVELEVVDQRLHRRLQASTQAQTTHNSSRGVRSSVQQLNSTAEIEQVWSEPEHASTQWLLAHLHLAAFGGCNLSVVNADLALRHLVHALRNNAHGLPHLLAAD